MSEEVDADEVMSDKELTKLMMEMAAQIYGGMIASGQKPSKDLQETAIEEAIELMNMVYNWGEQKN